MSLFALVFRNVLRNKFRTGVTALVLALALVVFMLMHVLVDAWSARVRVAAPDRLFTRNKNSIALFMPKRYYDEIRRLPGVTNATYGMWFGGRDPNRPELFFATWAAAPYVWDVYDESVLPPDQKAAWIADRQGAVIGDQLAAKTGWKIGDRVTLVSSLVPGDWTFTIRGIYSMKRPTFERTVFTFHWDYFNSRAPAPFKDHVGYIASKISDSSRSAAVAAAIDRLFEDRDIQTLTTSELAFNVSFISMVSSFLSALGYISGIIILIILIILANTTSMGVRERTNEYGMLKAVGFMPRDVIRMVIGESVILGLLGALFGLVLAYPLINYAIAPVLEQNLGFFFAKVELSARTAIKALVVSLLVAVAAGAWPAWSASRLQVTDALRRIA